MQYHKSFLSVGRSLNSVKPSIEVILKSATYIVDIPHMDLIIYLEGRGHFMSFLNVIGLVR